MASAPQPALLWSFNGTLKESVTGYLPVGTTGGTNPTGASLAFTSGKYGQGLQFIPNTSNGFSLYTTTNTSIPLAGTYFPYAGGMTVSFWYLPTSLATTGLLFSTGSYKTLSTLGAGDLIYIYVTTSGSIQLNAKTVGGNPIYNFQIGTVAVNNWVHVAFGVDTTNIYTYINGVRTSTIAQPTGWATNELPSSGYWMGTMAIGTQSFAGSNGSLTGIMNDLRVYSSNLSAAQIYGIYQSQGIPPTITMVPSAGGAPSPTYAWPFQNSVIDAVQGVYPASANVGGVNWNTWNSGNTWPYYDSTAPVYGTNSIIFNNISSVYSNGISYNINSPFGGSNSFAITFWLKPITASYGYYLTLSGVGGTINFWINSSYGMAWSAASSLAFITNGFPNISAVVNKWMHIGFSITNTGSSITSQFFTNGTGGLVSSSSSILGSNVFTSLSLGRFQGGAGELEAGVEFGDLRIFNTALTSTQIRTIYQSGGNLYGANTVQPALFWSFNGTLKESVTGYLPVGTTGGTNPTGSSLAFTSGKYGQGLQFIPYLSNGFGLWNTTNYSIPLAGTYFPYAGGMSVSFWYMPTSLATDGLLFSSSSFKSLTVYGQLDLIYLNLLTSGAIVINGQSAGSGGFYGTQIGTVAVNNWVHVSFGVDTQNIYTYINGVLTKTIAQPAGWATTDITSSGYWMGGMSVGTQHFAYQNGALTGIMNDLRVYSSLLSASQIQAIYQSGGIPPTLTMVPSTGNYLPSPYLAWPFQGSTIDVIQNQNTSSSNVNGAYNASTNPNQLYPYYDTSTQLTGTSSLRLFNSNTAPAASNTITYTLSGLPVDTTGRAVTISFWFKWINNDFNISYPIRFGFPGLGGISFSRSGSNLYLNGGLISGTTFTQGSTSFAFATQDKWYHVTFVFTAAQVLVYGNGAFVGNGIGSFSPPLTVQGGTSNIINTVTLGTVGPAGFASVEFGDLRIYNSALSSAQIQTIYNFGGNLYGGNLVQPTYMWPFNGSTIDVIQGKDFGTSNVSGTLNVRPYTFYDTTGQKAGNSSIVFNNPTGFASNALIYNVSFPIDQSNACTYSFWFKWITFGGALFKVYTSTGGPMGTIQTSGNNLNMVFGTIAGSSILGITTTFNISSLSVWYHVAVVATSLGQTVYGNGNLLGTSLYTTPLNIQQTANTIGSISLSCVNGLGSNPTLATSNEIADLRFYNTALSASQIQTIYQSGGASPMVNIT